MLAAIRAGVTTVIIPEQNRKDLEEIPKQIMKKITVIPVKWIDEVLKVALVAYPPPPVDRSETPAEPPKKKPAPRRNTHRPPALSV
jgi:ATP-dependent Lon protease